MLAITLYCSLGLLLLLSFATPLDGFVVGQPTRSRVGGNNNNNLGAPFTRYASLSDISSMKASQMRKELESYGISTKSLLEKSEFKEALEQARAQGKKPIDETSSSKESSSAPPPNGASSGGKSKSSSSSSPKEKLYNDALEKAQKMSLGDIRKELKARGISFKSFLEKSEFFKAYAEAIVDNKTTGSGGGGGRRAAADVKEEAFDPDYRDVVMIKIDRRQMAGQSVIDVTPRR
jgi:predicted HTH domain antitoxin